MKNNTPIQETLNTKVDTIEPTVKTTIQSVQLTEHNSEGDSYIKLKVKPKVKIGSLVKGDLDGAFGNTQLNMEFGKSFTDDNVEIILKVNGNLAAVYNSPAGTGKVSAQFCATKKF